MRCGDPPPSVAVGRGGGHPGPGGRNGAAAGPGPLPDLRNHRSRRGTGALPRSGGQGVYRDAVDGRELHVGYVRRGGSREPGAGQLLCEPRAGERLHIPRLRAGLRRRGLSASDAQQPVAGRSGFRPPRRELGFAGCGDDRNPAPGAGRLLAGARLCPAARHCDLYTLQLAGRRDEAARLEGAAFGRAGAELVRRALGDQSLGNAEPAVLRQRRRFPQAG